MESYKAFIKKYYLWKTDSDSIPRELRAYLRTNKKAVKRKKPDDLITEKEYSKLIETCGNSRDRALVSFAYDSGCRVSEIASLRIKDVSFDSYGLVAKASGKVGNRIARTMDQSVPFIKE